MEPTEDRSMSLEIIEVRADDRTRVEPILDWLPRRGWWLGPAVVSVALLVGFVLGFVIRGLMITPSAPSSGTWRLAVTENDLFLMLTTLFSDSRPMPG